MTAVDPAVGLIVRGALSLLFAWAAVHKLRDRARFRSTLASYAVLPSRWIGPCAVGLIALESSLAAGLWLPGCAVIAGLGGAGLLVLYAAAIAINLARGRRDIDCGCGGAAGANSLSAALVVRNAILAVAAGMTALPVAARPLGWVDGVTIAAAVATLVLLYAAVDTLLANAPLLATLSGSERRRSSMLWQGLSVNVGGPSIRPLRRWGLLGTNGEESSKSSTRPFALSSRLLLAAYRRAGRKDQHA